MKDNQFFDEKVTEAAEIAIDINDVHKKRRNVIAGLFKKIFNEKTSVFKKIHSFLYYKSGRPNDDTKPKLPELMENFISVVKWYEFAGRKHEIDRILGNHGLSLTVISSSTVSVNNDEKIKEEWDDLFDTPMPAKDIDIFNMLMAGADSSMDAKYTLEEEIDADIAHKVEMKCGINKAQFKKAVKLKAEILEGKDVSDKIKNIEEKADQMSQMIERL